MRQEKITLKCRIIKFIKSIVPKKKREMIKLLISKARFFGFKFRCPFCNSYLANFLAAGYNYPVLETKRVIGAGYRLTAQCPVCHSLDRERLIYLFLLNKTKIFDEDLKLLHIAPEYRLEAVFCEKKKIDYLTADLNSNSTMVKMDVTDIHFPNESFDFIICNHVLEHVVDDRKAMSELFRTLKFGGYAILQVPMSLSLEDTYEDHSVVTPGEREKAFGQADHVRIYAKKDYKNRLEQSGFMVKEFDWSCDDENFGGPSNKFGLIDNETVFFATKQ